MQTTVPLACFLSLIRPPGIQFENALLQIAPVNKGKCPFVRDNNDLVFQLYTRHNPTVAHSLLIDDDESLFASSIDFNDRTVIYFHAFMETPDDGSGLMIREAYTHRGDTNVIMVDAQRLEAGPWYFKAAENTWYIGRIAAQFIDYLVSRGLKLSKTHLVGHSLGAQAAGVAGSTLKSGRVSRITGLDPALPLFDKLPLQQRLDPSDAEFVDVIHTDAGIFGFPHQVGHVDFYPNGGISPQPGCELEVVIPQQQLLTKCNETQSIGFYVYHLQAKQSNTLKKLETILKIIATSTNAINSIKHRARNQPTKMTSPITKLLIGHKKPKFNKRQNFNTDIITKSFKYLNQKRKMTLNHRQRRFIRNDQTNGNVLLRILKFVLRNHNKMAPILTVIREINTIMKDGNNLISHTIKEQNEFTGNYPVTIKPLAYTFELNSDSKLKAFLKRLIGIGQSNKLTVSK